TRDTDGNVAVEPDLSSVSRALQDLLAATNGGIVMCSAMTPEERLLASAQRLLNASGNVWVRFVAHPESEFNLFYHRFSNPGLWMLYHGIADPGAEKDDLTERVFDAYKNVNYRFALAISEMASYIPGAKVLIQDYHVQLAARAIRMLGGNEVLNQFIHIPWPRSEYLMSVVTPVILKEILDGMLANDTVGFQTREFADNFIEACEKVFHVGVELNGDVALISYRGRKTSVKVNPISIDVRLEKAAAGEADILEMSMDLKKKFAGKLIIGKFERMDLTKGVLEGARAFRLLLHKHPELIEKVVIIYGLEPSRQNLTPYQKMQEEFEKTVDSINAEFSPHAHINGIFRNGLEGSPLAEKNLPIFIVDMNPRKMLFVLSFISDVVLANPVVDGMNLSVKVVAALNDPLYRENINAIMRTGSRQPVVEFAPAAVVASRAMGAYSEINVGALSVDPNDIEEIADTLHEALMMGTKERTDRAALMAAQVLKNTRADWIERILALDGGMEVTGIEEDCSGDMGVNIPAEIDALDVLAENFMHAYYCDRPLPWSDIEGLFGAAFSINPGLAYTGRNLLIGRVVEHLADSYSNRGMMVNFELLARMIQFARVLPEGQRLNRMLNEFDIITQEDLLRRVHLLLEKRTRFSPEQRKKIVKIFIPSRVTIGSDILLTSMIIDKGRSAFPHASYVIFANKNTHQHFFDDAGYPALSISIHHLDVQRRSLLIDSLGYWVEIVEHIAKQTDGADDGSWIAIDPFSRLTQSGLLPLARHIQNEYLFQASCQANETRIVSLGEKCSTWLEAQFGDSGKRGWPRLYLKKAHTQFADSISRQFGFNEKFVISMKLGSNGDMFKKAGRDIKENIDFEESLISRLLAQGKDVLLDKGYGDEITEADEIIAALRKAGNQVIEIADDNYEHEQFPMDTLRPFLIAWEGKPGETIGKFAALTRYTKLYIGYDSMGQHMAAACEIPVITIMAGAPTDAFYHRWTPYSRATVKPVRVTEAKRGRSNEILEEIIAKVAEIENEIRVSGSVSDFYGGEGLENVIKYFAGKDRKNLSAEANALLLLGNDDADGGHKGSFAGYLGEAKHSVIPRSIMQAAGKGRLVDVKADVLRELKIWLVNDIVRGPPKDGGNNLDKIAKEFELTEVEKAYFGQLYRQFKEFLAGATDATARVMVIGEDFWPSALLSNQDRHDLLGAVDYEELLRDLKNKFAAHHIHLILNP
ncbi:MAG: trehalose-6-phosphate synthase, partial [Candidatus Omnitrophota bacterium]